MERIVRDNGATPATVAIMEGRIHIGNNDYNNNNRNNSHNNNNNSNNNSNPRTQGV